MKTCLIAATLLLLQSACSYDKGTGYTPKIKIAPTLAANILNPSGRTLATRFSTPPGFKRTAAGNDSYTAYLRLLPLKPNAAPVHYYNGAVKENNGIYAAVIDFDIGNKDLLQCADAAMRLRAEYLFAMGRQYAIHFNLTNGFRVDYSKWAEGYRVALGGNKASWIKKAALDTSYTNFRACLDFVFNYAGSLSLSKELKPVSWESLQPGDMLVIGGSPGHVETVMDVTENAKGDKAFLLSQSYMPAQDIQILQNPEEPDISPWYRLKEAPYIIVTPQYNFSTTNLMRWQ